MKKINKKTNKRNVKELKKYLKETGFNKEGSFGHDEYFDK